MADDEDEDDDGWRMMKTSPMTGNGFRLTV
jgi:hypothetical protein